MTKSQRLLTAVVAEIELLRRELTEKIAEFDDFGENDDFAQMEIAESEALIERLDQIIGLVCHAIDPSQHTKSLQISLSGRELPISVGLFACLSRIEDAAP